MKRIKPFSAENLEAICKVLAHTETGLTGSEIGHILDKCKIPDVTPDMAKWKRLYNAFVGEQDRRQDGNHIVAFIHKAMSPVRYVSSPGYFDFMRTELNRILAFSGLSFEEDGKLHKVKTAQTISEAEERANRLRFILENRGVHTDVLMFCNSELLQKNYFHAVLEATKSVANKIRLKSGLLSDGAELAQAAFALGKNGTPILAINSLQTDSEKSEQKGFFNLLIGLFGTFRNPTAHAEKIYWPIDEQDALDILSLVSLVHRKLDTVRKL